MGFNWRAAFGGAASAVSNTAGLLITDEVSKMREARMAQYQQAQVADERAYQDVVRAETTAVQQASQQAGFAQQSALQEDSQAHQSGMMREQMTLQEKAAEAKAIADAAAAEKALLDKKDFEAYKGTVNPDATPSQSKFEQELDSKGAALYDSLQTQNMAAEAMDESLTVLEDIAEGFDTGRKNEAIAKMGQWLGTEEGAAMQAYQSVAVDLVLGQAAKLSGTISDKDMELLERSMPNFGNDPRANQIILGILRKGIDRSRRNFLEADQFAKENRTLRGFSPSFVANVNTSEKSQESIGAANAPLDFISGFEKWDAEN